MDSHPRIELNPDRLSGKPVVRGARLSVEFVLGLLAEGWDRADVLMEYPALSTEDISACLAYARDVGQRP